MNNKGWIGVAIIILLVVGIVGFVVGYEINYAITDSEEVITVKTKWTKIVTGTEKYRITSTNGQTFKVADSLFHGQFESASIYANMDEGKTYKIRTQGFRYGFFSDFKKITRTELVD